MSAKSKGIARERQVLDVLAKDDWFAFRSPASLGFADVIALKKDHRPRFYEVKATAGGPYERFGPTARCRLALAAKEAGALAFLAWWPPRGRLIVIPEAEWPAAQEKAA